jgi:lipopolysaccharide/colanic/teichoic acid biosynthesis glycosyltransferase
VGGVAAAFSQVPSWKPILDITCVLLTISLWLPVVLLLTLWIKLASPGPHCFSAEARRLLRQTFHDRQLQDNEDERRDADP